MIAPALPAYEDKRLEALRREEILDTPPEPAFDDLTELASHIAGTPIALISFVDEDRQWFKSRRRFPFPQTPRAVSFCGHAILASRTFVVPDATRDERFRDNPLVIGEPNVRFYAGTQIRTADGHAIGTLCVMDTAPRQLDPAQEKALEALGRQVTAQLQLRVRTRTALEHEARLRLVTDNARVGLVVVSHEHRYVYANQAYAESLGLETTDLVGRHVSSVFPDIYESQIRPNLEAALTGRRVAYELSRDDARHTCLSVRYEPGRGRDGHPLVVAVVVDLTEQKQTERALRERKGLLRLYALHSPLAVAMFDREMRYLIASHRWVDAYQLGGQQLIGRSHYDVFPNLPQAWKDIHQHCLAGHVARAAEDRLQLADGTTAWLRWEVRPWFRDDGTVGGLLIFSEDITEQKTAVDALRASEERSRFALENAGVGVWDRDYVAGSLRWSETLEAQYGFAPGTFPGTFEAFVNRVHPDDREALLQAFAGAAEVGRDFAVEHRALWPDGTVRWLRGAGRIQLGPDRRPIRGVGISQDITERRTLELQYRQAQKMEALGRLAGGIAHDFNNLLTAILGYSELLIGDFASNEPLVADLQEVHKAGLAGAALTRQLLAFSRKEITEPTRLDVNVVVTDLQRLFKRLIGEDVRLTIAPSEQPAIVMADRGQMEQVLMNLAVNARDAMPGGGELTVSVTLVTLDARTLPGQFSAAPGRFVAVAVKDTGVGMTDQVLAHIFEPFFTTKEQGKGTGLGLATVHGIVSNLGGAVAVDSRPGRGTSFTVLIPEAIGDATTDEAGDVTTEDPDHQRAVLVVDDSEPLRELTRRVLTRLGWAVHVAEDARQAIAIADTHPEIEVVLTDVVMPGISGPELVEVLSLRRPDLRFLFMSGYTGEALTHHGVSSTVMLLQKPFTAEALERKLREVLAANP